MEKIAKLEPSDKYTNKIVEINGIEFRLVGMRYADKVVGYLLQPTDLFNNEGEPNDN